MHLQERGVKPQRLQKTDCFPTFSYPANPQVHFLSPLLHHKIHSSSCNYRCEKDLLIKKKTKKLNRYAFFSLCQLCLLYFLCFFHPSRSVQCGPPHNSQQS